jgi:hypothetical protein
MLDRTIVLWTIAGFAWTTPVAAQAPAPAPTTAAFDGTCAGGSRALEGTMLNQTTRCPPLAQPGPLTIVGGMAPTALGNTSYVGEGTAEGSVTPQGVLVLRTAFGERIDAQIDGRGIVTADTPAPATTRWSGRRRASEPYPPSQCSIKTTTASRLRYLAV